MAIRSELNQEKLVSSASGANYTNLNDAIANIGTIKTFRLETAITLTANITFPSGVTIIIGSQASLTGAFTLTGNKTVITFEGLSSCINTNITFAGTWLIERLYPEQFGAVGDGVTDDTVALNKCHDLARLTESKTVVLSRTYKTSLLINCTNTHQDWKPYAHIIGTNGHMVLQAAGTFGTYRNLTANALEATNTLTCATLASEVVSGDIINIISNKEFAIGYPQGELMQVEGVSGAVITFKDYFHDTYLTSDTARACKCSMAKFSHTGKVKISMPINTVDYDTDRYTDGIQLKLCDRPILFCEANKFANASIQISDCYEPIIYGFTHYGEMDGLGYGLAINGATKRANIYGNFIGHRAPCDTGGSTSGVPWDIRFNQVNAAITVDDDGACFLTHYNTGSVFFSQCEAYGIGVAENRHAGYTLNARYNRIDNCRTKDIYLGIFSTGTATKDLEINNFTCINAQYGIKGSQDSPIPNFRVNGFRVENDTLQTGVIFYLAGSVINNWSFKNIIAKNLSGVFSLAKLGSNTYPSKLVIEGLIHENDTLGANASIYLTHESLVDIIINRYSAKNIDQIIYTNSVSAGLKTFSIHSGILDVLGNVKMSELYPAMDLIHFDNVIIKNPVTAASKLIYSANGATTIKITNCHTEGANMDYLTDVVTGKTFTNFLHQGNDFISLTGAHKTQTPTNTITSGSIGL